MDSWLLGKEKDIPTFSKFYYKAVKNTFEAKILSPRCINLFELYSTIN